MISNKAIVISGAYGRFYTSEQSVIDDWDANKDFRMHNQIFGYINKSDFEKYGNALDYVLFQNRYISVIFWHSSLKMRSTA